MLIISGSNNSKTKRNSQSLKVAHRIKQKLNIKNENIKIIDLREYKIFSCIMCEKCALTKQCNQDDHFNKLYNVMKNNQTIIFIIPHYAGIPSKIIAILEKMQEIFYLQYCQGNEIHVHAKIGIIAHGGMSENYSDVYVNNIIQPFSYMVKNLGYEVINEKIEKPLCFGVKKYYKIIESGSYCFKKEDDIDKREEIINILIEEINKEN